MNGTDLDVTLDEIERREDAAVRIAELTNTRMPVTNEIAWVLGARATEAIADRIAETGCTLADIGAAFTAAHPTPATDKETR